MYDEKYLWCRRVETPRLDHTQQGLDHDSPERSPLPEANQDNKSQLLSM